MEDRRVQVAHVAAALDRLAPELVRGPDRLPPFTPAPASHMEKPCQSWSRPGLPTPSLVGVRPNSPPHTSSVSSHSPRRLRSAISAPIGLSVSPAWVLWFAMQSL